MCVIVFVCVCLLPGVCVLQGPSVLPCWPSAWNESVWCLWCVQRGFLFFRRWTVMHYWSQNTPAMAFHLLSTAESLLCFFFFLSEGFTVHACSSLAGWLDTSLLWVMFCFCFVVFHSSAQTPPPAAPPSRYLLFPVAPRGRLNSRYAETATWWSHLSVQCWQRTAQDKRQR